MATLTLPIPPEPLSASAFVDSIKHLDRHQREHAALGALLAGHVPDCMRSFVDVPADFTDVSGVHHTLVVSVLPDFLCIGSDEERLRIPLTPLTAQKVSDAWACVMPTPKLARLVWTATEGKVPPEPWGPPYDASMMSTDRIVAHNARIDATVKRLGLDAVGLLAGHKKDVVLTKQLVAHPKQVAIFGWFKSDGHPIQPLYLGHENAYADYSHGIRMVSRECILDGNLIDLAWLLQDPGLCAGVSDEGPLPLVRQPMT